jgi:hypothetical protein
MNNHILNGNRMLATAGTDGSEMVKRHGHIGYSFKHIKDVSRVANEYFKAFDDDLTETERWIVNNRLTELAWFIVNPWIAEHYGGKKAAASKPVELKQVKTSEPAIEKPMNLINGHISNIDRTDGGLIFLFHYHPTRASEFNHKLPRSVRAYCRDDTGYVRIHF